MGILGLSSTPLLSGLMVCRWTWPLRAAPWAPSPVLAPTQPPPQLCLWLLPTDCLHPVFPCVYKSG